MKKIDFKNYKRISVTLVLAISFLLVNSVFAWSNWVTAPTPDPTGQDSNNPDQTINISSQEQAKGGSVIAGSKLDINGTMSAQHIASWDAVNVVLSSSVGYLCYLLPAGSCDQSGPGLLGVWGVGKFLNSTLWSDQARVVIGTNPSGNLASGKALTINLAGRTNLSNGGDGSGRDAISIISDAQEDHSNIVVNKSIFGTWSTAYNAWADAHFRGGLSDQGMVTIDVSSKTGDEGRRPLTIIGGSGTDAVGVIQNKQIFGFYSTVPQSITGAVTVQAKNVQLQDGNQAQDKILVSNGSGLGSWQTPYLNNPLATGVVVVKNTDRGSPSVNAVCPSGYRVIGGGGWCFVDNGNGSRIMKSSEPGPGLSSDTTNGALSSFTYWHVDCTDEGGGGDNAVAMAICSPSTNVTTHAAPTAAQTSPTYHKAYGEGNTGESCESWLQRTGQYLGTPPRAWSSGYNAYSTTNCVYTNGNSYDAGLSCSILFWQSTPPGLRPTSICHTDAIGGPNQNGQDWTEAFY